jgi:tetratricopeptide (TPR) repeat protein
VLRALIERFAGLALAVAVVGLPLQLVTGRNSVPWLLLSSVLGLWGGRLLRRGLVASATRALARGECTKARRRYTVVRLTALSRSIRLSCQLSLAACDAADGRFEACLRRLEHVEVPERETSLKAVALNLRAYCFARSGKELDRALGMSKECVAMRPHVPGFRHTRGLLLLELGRYEESIRDLEATWDEGDGSPLFESERCFDLGRLWALRGQEDYARDYFARALRAYPDGPWAEKASLRVGPPSRAATDALETLF